MDLFFRTRKNHGVIRDRKSTDWVAGQIPYEVRNPDGVWPLVRSERQRFKNVETMACVSFAALSGCEVQILDQTGVEINFADRALAKLSGTTTQGNRVTTVLDTLRHMGAVHEEEWPAPLEPFGWANYYSDIPPFIVSRGKAQFLDKYDLQYEYIPDHSPAVVAYHLKHAPLMITVPGHEMLAVALNGDKLTLLDTYPGTGDYLKVVRLSQVTDIFKAVLTVKQINEDHMKIVNDNGTYYLVGDKGKMGINGQESLDFFRRLTSKEEKGSTAGIPSQGTFEKHFGVDID